MLVIRCVWRFRRHSPGKDWHFLGKLPKSGADLSKRIVQSTREWRAEGVRPAEWHHRTRGPTHKPPWPCGSPCPTTLGHRGSKDTTSDVSLPRAICYMKPICTWQCTVFVSCMIRMTGIRLIRHTTQLCTRHTILCDLMICIQIPALVR